MSAQRARFLATIAVFLIRPLVWSLRLHMVDRAGVLSATPARPLIWAFWHNRLFLIPFIFRKYFPSTRGAALTSLSKDGEILAAYIARFGIESVRGSSSRGGGAALIAMKRALDRGAVCAITPDGPRGPRYSLQPGILKLAQLADAWIMPVHIRFSKAWRLKSWDAFIIPKPFARVEVILDTLCSVSRDGSPEEFELRREELEAVMKRHAEWSKEDAAGFGSPSPAGSE